MIMLLYSFSKDEPYKWLTHQSDFGIANIDYKSIIKQIKPVFDRDVNFTTRDFVNAFIGKHKVKKNISIFYPEYKSEFSYGHECIIKPINEGENPFDIILNNIVRFSDVIIKFKHAIEFRLDVPELSFKKLFTKFIDDKLSLDFGMKVFSDNFSIISAQLSTYIDTNNFFSGMEIIIGWLNSYKSLSNKIEIDLHSTSEVYMLTIFHKNSQIKKDSNDNKLKGTSGDLETLRKKWFSVVDFNIEADLIDGPFSISCLDNDTTLSFIEDVSRKGKTPSLSENKIIKQNNKIGGVKYTIKIYKNNS